MVRGGLHMGNKTAEWVEQILEILKEIENEMNEGEQEG